MIAHAGVSVRDYAKAKKFYEAALKPLGYKLTADYADYKAGGFKQGGHTDFWINVPKKFATTHLAFLASSKKAVQKFYEAALAAGGKNNGAPAFGSTTARPTTQPL